MTKNKIITLTIIGVIGVGFFILFINILAEEDLSDESSTPEAITITEILEEEPSTAEDEVVSELVEEEVVSEIVEDEVPPVEEFTEISDGMYDAFVEYLSPKGFRDSIDVTMTVEEGVVTEVEVEHTRNNPDSAFYQDEFDKEYKALVIGENIEEIDLSRVGGASLTTDAFMEAVDEIIKQI